jgi:hypothetical protein
MFAHASGRFAAQGDAQAVEFVLRNTTSGTTPANLYLDGGVTSLYLRDKTVLSGICTITGIKLNGSKVGLYQRSISIKSIGGNVSLVHSSTISTDHEDDATWDVSISAVPIDAALAITCTGAAGDDIRWVAVFRGLEIGIP